MTSLVIQERDNEGDRLVLSRRQAESKQGHPALHISENAWLVLSIHHIPPNPGETRYRGSCLIILPPGPYGSHQLRAMWSTPANQAQTHRNQAATCFLLYGDSDSEIVAKPQWHWADMNLLAKQLAWHTCSVRGNKYLTSFPNVKQQHICILEEE